MQDSVSQDIHKAAQALLAAVRTSGVNIAEVLNPTLNQFLTWPLKAGSVHIIDSEGNSTIFDTTIYTNAVAESDSQPAEIKADVIACGIHVAGTLGPEELRSGYEHIAAMKRLKRTHMPKVEYPINSTPLGIIFAVDSVIPVEKIAELMLTLNKSYPSTEWTDMVVILTRGTINYAVQIHGEPIKGDFLLPNNTNGPVMPIYVHLFARGLGLFSMNKMCQFLFMHLQTFSPGIKLPNTEEILRDVPPFGITFGAYQFNLKCQLVPVPAEVYLKQGVLAPFPFRIEDSKGNLLSHVQFIPWQDGGAVRSTGKIPLEGILVFFGSIAADAHIIKQSDGAISSVLPIQESEFREMLARFQSQSNMRIKVERPEGVVSKFADEGTTSPFMARLFLGILRLRDAALSDIEKRKEFDKAYQIVLDALMNARTASKEIIQTIAEHSRKVSQGEIARVNGAVIHISENIDHKLRRQVEEFLYSTVRGLKDGMQKVLEVSQLDSIGFLFKKQSTFENGLAALTKTRPELAAYLKEVQEWSGKLVLTRNSLHEGWSLPRMRYEKTAGGIQIIEPEIAGQLVSEFVEYMLDRLCCFVEEVSAYALQAQMPSGISITEIPVSDRKADCLERFQITSTAGGMASWTIAYHFSRFEET